MRVWARSLVGEGEPAGVGARAGGEGERGAGGGGEFARLGDLVELGERPRRPCRARRGSRRAGTCRAGSISASRAGDPRRRRRAASAVVSTLNHLLADDEAVGGRDAVVERLFEDLGALVGLALGGEDPRLQLGDGQAVGVDRGEPGELAPRRRRGRSARAGGWRRRQDRLGPRAVARGGPGGVVAGPVRLVRRGQQPGELAVDLGLVGNLGREPFEDRPRPCWRCAES